MEAERTLAQVTVEKAIPQKQSRTSFFVKMFFLLVLVVAIIIAAAIAILRNDHYQFREVRVYDTTTFSSDDIVAFTHDYWSGTRFGSIPKTSTILFSKDAFEHVVLKQFPVISNAYITLPEPDILEIHITERTPFIVWCFADETCGFVDNGGTLYGKAPQFSDGVYPIFQSELNDPTYKKFGMQVIDPALMNRFVDLSKRLQSDDIALSRTFLYENGDVAFFIDRLFGMYTRDNTRLLGKIAQDDELFVRDMLIGLGNEAFKKQFLANPKDLEYIDMRFAGKIFYKFVSGQRPVEKTAEVQ